MPKKATKQTISNPVDGNAGFTPEQLAVIAQLLGSSAPTQPVATSVVHPFVNVLIAAINKQSAARRSSFATSVGLLQSAKGSYVMPTFECYVRICLDGVNDFSKEGSLRKLIKTFDGSQAEVNKVKTLKTVFKSIDCNEISLLLNAVK